MIPDVSLVATGLGIVLNGKAPAMGGTSAAAPLVGGVHGAVNRPTALAGGSVEAPTGFLNPTLYHLASASSVQLQRHRGR